MAYICLSEYVYDCNQCSTRCDGISKGVYSFSNDVSFSELYEQMIIDRINSSHKYSACKCNEPGFPDIEVRDAGKKLSNYIEVKVQQRTFMNVQKLLPKSNLTPSETVALNESDLLRYFAIAKTVAIPTTIVWVLMNRLCILPSPTQKFYYQDIAQLECLYHQYGSLRRFKRKSGEGDVVDGLHKGVTVNYHFSLKELKQWIWKK